MKPEEQRIAIAEACGWKPDDDGDGTGWKGSWIHQRLIGMKPTFRGGKVVSYLIEQTVPDYLNDLNAMHEAEKVLTTRAQISQYVWELERLTNWKADYIVGSDGKQYLCPASYFCCVNATATQRAEAFLRTLNLWKP